MSSPPVRIPITASDETGAAFASAQARMQSFKTSATGSFTEARAATKLFSEELGVGLNRELTKIIAQSAVLQGALSAALPIAGIIGFAEVAARIPDMLDRAWESLSGAKAQDAVIEANAKLQEILHKIAEDTAAAAASYALIGKSAQQTALQEQMAAASRLISAQAQLSLLQSALAGEEARSKEMERPSVGGGSFRGGYESSSQPTAAARAAGEMAEAYKSQIAVLQEGMTKLQIGFDSAGKKLDSSLTSAFDKAQKSAEQLKKELSSIMADVDRMPSIGWNMPSRARLYNQLAPIGSTDQQSMPDMGQLTASMPLYSGSKPAADLYKIQTDQTAAVAAAQEVYAQTAPAAQKYTDTMAALNELLKQGRISQQQFSMASAQAAAGLNKAEGFDKYFKEIGADIGKTIEQAALFGESWSKAFRTLLADVVKLILQMYVFKALSTQFGGANGGFMGALFAGMAGGGGKAGGGPVSSGMSYLVGEQGPEIFTPGANGAITPNGSLGGSVIYNIDARGADSSVERRIMALLPIVESRAVARAAAVISDRRART